MMDCDGACDSDTAEEMFEGFWMGRSEETAWKAQALTVK
jgi:hypothetical protein